MRIVTSRTARLALIALAILVLPGAARARPPGDPRRPIQTGVERDHDLASTMKFSVLWFYQEVARLRGSTFDALMPMRRELAEQLLRSHGVLPPP